MSQVVIHKKPSGPKRIRPPLWAPGPPSRRASLKAMSGTMSVRSLTRVQSALTARRLTVPAVRAPEPPLVGSFVRWPWWSGECLAGDAVGLRPLSCRAHCEGSAEENPASGDSVGLTTNQDLSWRLTER